MVEINLCLQVATNALMLQYIIKNLLTTIDLINLQATYKQTQQIHMYVIHIEI